MYRCFSHFFMASILLFLWGCQSNPTPSNVFNPFTFTPTVSLGQKVQEALQRSEDPLIAQIQVQTRQDVVVLNGYVKKIRQSDVAEQIARQVPGVQAVENNIIIRQ